MAWVDWNNFANAKWSIAVWITNAIDFVFHHHDQRIRQWSQFDQMLNTCWPIGWSINLDYNENRLENQSCFAERQGLTSPSGGFKHNACVINSESLCVDNPTPRSNTFRRKLSQLTNSPLWATAIAPCAVCTTNGWQFTSSELADVEYRVCPMPKFPLSLRIASSLKMWLIMPMPL